MSDLKDSLRSSFAQGLSAWVDAELGLEPSTQGNNPAQTVSHQAGETPRLTGTTSQPISGNNKLLLIGGGVALLVVVLLVARR
jgi:hypothetical protein